MAKDNIRHLQDYYDEILKKYPDVTRDELDKLLKHAFRAFYMLNGYGADVKFKFNNCVMYVGHLFKDKVKRARYFFVKWGVKYRIM